MRVLAIFALVLLPVSVARADDGRARALSLVREGNRLLQRRDCEAALARFQQARQAYPQSYKIEVNLGSARECLGELPRAAEHFEAFLRRSDEARDARMRRSVRQKVARLRRRLTRLELVCPVDGAHVTVDGAVVGVTPLPPTVYLEPGTRELRVRRAGHPPFSWKGKLAAGELRRIVVPWGEAGQTTAPAPEPLSPALLSPPDRAPPVEEPTAAAKPWYKRWWVWTLVGAAVAGATVGVVASQTGGSDRLPRGEAGTIWLD
jgi:hypothetical protein